MKKLVFAILFTAVFFSTSAQAALNKITASGALIAANASGELGNIALGLTRQFSYEATFDFDAIDTSNPRENGEGYKVYPINDGGITYQNKATIFDPLDPSFTNRVYESNLVEVEFADNQSYDWTDPGLQFLDAIDGTEDGALNLPVGYAFDFIVFGFNIEDAGGLMTDFYLTLFFDEGYFETDDNDLPTQPTSIDTNQILLTAGEFAEKQRNPDGSVIDIGWAQVLGAGSNVEVVPIPGALILLGSGLLGLAGYRRKINN